jgi:hypothetical protein
MRFLGMTAVEKLRARQASRLTYIKAAEANSKLFYLQANGRRRKNHIHSLESPSGTGYLQQDKEKIVYDHFSTHFGRHDEREVT